MSTKFPPSVASPTFQERSLPRPRPSQDLSSVADVGESKLPDFDDGPTEIGSSWFPPAPDHRVAAPSQLSSRPPSRPGPPLRASQGNPPFRSPPKQEDVISFPAASSTVPPRLAEPVGELRHSAVSAAKGVAFGLAITGLLGVGAIAYKATLGHSATAAAAAAASGAAPVAWTLDGDVEPSRQASIQARGAGKVDELDVAVGTAVHEGDVLAKISGAAASTVRAPFDGVITAVYTTRGAEIAAGSSLPIADLADTSHVRVRLPLASGDEAKVRAGDAVTVWSEAAPTHTLRATVSRVIPSLNTRVASAEVDLDRPGLTPLDRVHAQLR